MSKTYIIAEGGINHNGNLKYALNLAKDAKEAGCDAIKFQTYITEKRVVRTSPIFDILKKCELSFNDFKEIKYYCKSINIEFLTTAFDEESLDYVCDDLKIKQIKVASFDTSNLIFLKKIINKNIKTIISLGMTHLPDINKIYKLFKNKKKLIFLHCVSGYPISDIETNLSNIEFLKNKFKNIDIGYSDHTKSIDIPSNAVLVGAKIIEKHFYLSNVKNCPDFPVSLNLKEMKEMIKKIRNIENILGKPNFQIKNAEKNILQFKRHSK